MRKHLYAALLVLGTALGGLEAMAVEEAKFDVAMKDGACELRDYAAHVVAEVVVKGTREAAGNDAFRILFKYISGANTSKAKIAMTAPVGQQQASQKIAMTAPVEQRQAADGWAVSFMMPAGFTLASTPAPTDTRVTLREVPAHRAAAIRYAGTWSEKNYQKHKAELDAWIKANGLNAAGEEPVWARYNPPFTPWFMRRNEILIPVKKDVVPPALVAPAAR